jgi:hypothetical protein
MKGGRLFSIKLELSEMKSKQVTNKEFGLGVLGKGSKFKSMSFWIAKQ